MIIDYSACVMRLQPGVNIGINGPTDVYESISLRAPGEMPTQAACDAIWPTIEAEILAQEAQDAKREPARARIKALDIAAKKASANGSPWVAEIWGAIEDLRIALDME